MRSTASRVTGNLVESLARAPKRWLPFGAALLAACSGSIDYPDGTELAPSSAEPGTSSPTSGDQQASSDGTAVVPGEPAPLPEDGAGLYEVLCMTCHGEEGTGSSIAPELQHPPPDHFRWVVRNGLTGAYESAMVALPEAGLTDVQLESILDYLSQLPEPDTDEGLYLDYCANCHGADARGGVARKEIAGKREALEVIREGKGGTDYAARTRYMPSWQSGALDDDVVARIEAYVGGLPE